MKGTIRQRGKSSQVRYWDHTVNKEIAKSFASYGDAELFLAHLNVSRHEGKLDARDYAKDNPLGFEAQAVKYLDGKSNKDMGHLHSHFGRACAFFGGKNVKDIDFAELDDFRLGLEKQGLGGKTIYNHFKSIHGFFTWFFRREKKKGYIMPDFPEIGRASCRERV